jgi:vWA-MoxR associated protein C-terminal domain/vWA-MoxR associated protein middle region (VMAP-M) 1
MEARVTSKSQRDEIDRLRVEFSYLQKLYQQIADDRRGTLDPENQAILENKLSSYVTRMAAAEQKLCAFQRDCLSSEMQQLLAFLASGKEPVRKKVVALYPWVNDLHSLDDRQPETLEDVLIELEDMQSIYSDYAPIDRLVAQLQFDPKIPKPLRPQLRTWLKSRGLDLSKLEAEVSQRETTNQYFLMVRVVANGAKRYTVSAWLLPKQPLSQELPPEDWGDPTQTFEFDQIPDLIQIWLKRSVEQIGESKDLTVHIFLPTEKLNTAIEQWKVNLKGESVWLGVECHQAVIRCDDRLLKLRQEEKYIDRWKARWQKVQTDDSCDCVDLLASGDCESEEIWRSLYVKLNRAEVIGCYFTAPPHDDMVDRLINLASPVLLWRRHPLPHCFNEWQRLLQQRISGLPNAVTRVREEAWGSKVQTMHLGSHLTLLWDDPDRLPPDVAAEFSHMKA